MFEYRNLRPDGNEIRLLDLLPSSHKANEIRCQIRHVQRSIAEYEALSYVWGPGRHTGLIRIGKAHVPIRENLWFALQALRDETRTRTLWVDALCINQSHIKERNKQVARMGEIYQNATTVVAWLGPENDLTALAFRSLEAIAHYHGHDEGFPTVLSLNKFFCNVQIPEIGQAIVDICCLGYWNRLWII